MSSRILRGLEQIESDYDPEHDVGSPQVTWADYRLLEAVKRLIEENEQLKARVDHLDNILREHQERLH